MNYYPFHIGDYAVHTRYLSLMEDLAYRRLLDLYYTLEGPIPSLDPAGDIGMAQHELDVAVVLRRFFVEVDGAWHNNRCDKEIATYKRMGEGGRRGAAKRWGKPSDSPPIATPIATKNQEPRTKENPPTPRKRGPSFDARTIELPAWLDAELWADWVADRNERGKRITERGAGQQLQTLDEYRGQGISPERVIRHAIASGNQGLYPPPQVKTNPADVARVTAPPSESAEAYLARVEAERKAAQRTPEQKAADDAARKLAISSVKRIAA